jgi:hypothetical protein
MTHDYLKPKGLEQAPPYAVKFRNEIKAYKGHTGTNLGPKNKE